MAKLETETTAEWIIREGINPIVGYHICKNPNSSKTVTEVSLPDIIKNGFKRNS